jgi:hypothetical protein
MEDIQILRKDSDCLTPDLLKMTASISIYSATISINALSVNIFCRINCVEGSSSEILAFYNS